MDEAWREDRAEDVLIIDDRGYEHFLARSAVSSSRLLRLAAATVHVRAAVGEPMLTWGAPGDLMNHETVEDVAAAIHQALNR